MESLKPYRMEIQRINTLYDQVADIKQTLSYCKYLNQRKNFKYCWFIHFEADAQYANIASRWRSSGLSYVAVI